MNLETFKELLLKQQSSGLTVRFVSKNICRCQIGAIGNASAQHLCKTH